MYVHSGTTTSNNTARPHGFRYWVDRHAFRSGHTTLYEEILQALGGQDAAVDDYEDGYEDDEPELLNGYDSISSWDIYLTGSRQASVVSTKLKPGQLIDSSAGSAAVASKSRLISTLQAHYGREMAGTVVPLSFNLPGETSQWQEWIRQNPEQVSVSVCRCA